MLVLMDLEKSQLVLKAPDGTYTRAFGGIIPGAEKIPRFEIVGTDLMNLVTGESGKHTVDELYKEMSKVHKDLTASDFNRIITMLRARGIIHVDKNHKVRSAVDPTE